MNIGFAYDLKDDYLAAGYSKLEVAEFDGLETIEGIEASLNRQGHRVDRIGNLNSLVTRLARGERWDLVFNIAEGLRGPTRESQIPALLEAYDIPFTFGDSLCLALCLHKGHSKRIVGEAGIPTARYRVVDSLRSDLRNLDLSYPLFVKPVAEGTGKGVTLRGKVADASALREICRELMEEFKQPVLVEEYLSGREFTVGVIGTGEEALVLGVMEVVLGDNADPELYTFDNKDRYEDRVSYRLATPGPEACQAAEIALASYRLLGCRDAGRVDIRSNGRQQPHFLELNPLAGLNPRHSDLPILCGLLGVGFDTLIGNIVLSARERLRHVRSR